MGVQHIEARVGEEPSTRVVRFEGRRGPAGFRRDGHGVDGAQPTRQERTRGREEIAIVRAAIDEVVHHDAQGLFPGIGSDFAAELRIPDGILAEAREGVEAKEVLKEGAHPGLESRRSEHPIELRREPIRRRQSSGGHGLEQRLVGTRVPEQVAHATRHGLVRKAKTIRTIGNGLRELHPEQELGRDEQARDEHFDADVEVPVFGRGAIRGLESGRERRLFRGAPQQARCDRAEERLRALRIRGARIPG